MSRVLKTGKETAKGFTEDLSKLVKSGASKGQPPNPDWKPGKKVEAPVGETVELDATQVDVRSIYKILTSAIVPRPIALVSSISADGKKNLSPFSAYNLVSSNPPALSISFARKRNGEKKDTLKNIEATREFVVNSASEWIAEPLNHCSADYDTGINELEKAGLTALPSSKVKPDRVEESPIQFECELLQAVEIGDGSAGSSTLVIGKIVRVHLMKNAFHGGRIDLDQLKPLSRLGGRSYGRTSGTFELERPIPGADTGAGGFSGTE